MTNEISTKLFSDVSKLVESARVRVGHYTNSILVVLNWQIGRRIYQEVLKEERAEYGEKIVKQLGKQLSIQYGRGFNERALFRMVRFAKLYPDEAIVATLSPLLSWSHFIELIALEDPSKREFYTEMSRLELWSVRELRKKLDGMLYERTAISRQPESVIQQDLKKLETQKELTQELVFRDPYILDFLQLPTAFSESDLEGAILRFRAQTFHILQNTM